MGSFFREIFPFGKKTLVLIIVASMWGAAAIDAFTTAIRPPGLFGGNLTKIVVAGTFLGLIVLFFYKLFSKGLKKKRIKKQMDNTEYLERNNRIKLEKILTMNKDFLTLCFECRHFNHDMGECSRRLDGLKLADFQFENKTLCLYWQEI